MPIKRRLSLLSGTAALVFAGIALSGCAFLEAIDAQPGAMKSAELTAVDNALTGAVNLLKQYETATPTPAWLADVETASTKAENALSAASTAYAAGASDAEALAAAAETAVGDLIGKLLSAGVPVPATVTAQLASAQGLHKQALERSAAIAAAPK